MKRNRVIAALLMIIGLTLLLLGLTRPGVSTLFVLGNPSDITSFTMPVAIQGACLVAAVIALGVGVMRLVPSTSRVLARHPMVPTAAVIATTSFALTAWAANGASLNVEGLLAGTLVLAVPIILGGLGGVVSERAGVVNIGIEGQMLAGAFMAAVLGTIAGNAIIGLLGGMVLGALTASLLALLSVRYLVDQIIVGIVANLLVLGVTSFLFAQVLRVAPAELNAPPILQPIRIPILSDIPLIGMPLFNQNIVVYATFGLTIFLSLTLFKTVWGVHLRSVGEFPAAAESSGINAVRMRYRAVLTGGAIAGLGGAFLTVGSVGTFTDNMVAGKGYLALAAVILGRWTPWGVFGTGLLFGFTYALQTTLTIVGTPVPSQIMLMIPYIVTIIAVAGASGRVRAPASVGMPYSRL